MFTLASASSTELKSQPRAGGPKPWAVVLAYGFCLVLLALLVALLKWTIWLWAAATVIFLLIGLAVARGRRRYLLPAFAVQGGLLVWFAASALVQPVNGVAAALIWGEIASVAVLLVVMLTVDHVWPSAVLLLYQTAAFFMNMYQMGVFSPDIVRNPLEGKEMIAGIALVRLVAILLIMVGAAQFEAARAASRTGQPVAAPPPPRPEPARPEVSADAAEDLRRLAALASEGVITQKGFEAKKRRILGL